MPVPLNRVSDVRGEKTTVKNPPQQKFTRGKAAREKRKGAHTKKKRFGGKGVDCATQPTNWLKNKYAH